MIIIILARNYQNIIGVNNTLPWKISEDLKFFRKKTTNNVVVMGYNTFRSIGLKPLKNRYNFVISHKKNIRDNSNLVFTDNFMEPVNYSIENNKDLYVIGGKSIFDFYLSMTDKILETKVNLKIYTDGNNVVYYKKDFKDFFLKSFSSDSVNKISTLIYQKHNK